VSIDAGAKGFPLASLSASIPSTVTAGAESFAEMPVERYYRDAQALALCGSSPGRDRLAIAGAILESAARGL